MSATGFTGTLNNAYIIPQPTTGGPTGGNWINWTVNANTVQAIGPTGALTTAMNFVVGGTGYATLSATGFVLTNPPVNGDSSNKVATTAWVMSNAPGGAGGALLAANNTFSGTNAFNNNNLTVNGVSVGKGANNVATNTALGLSTLAANTSGSNNTAVGSSALLTNQTGANNVAVGTNALRVTTASQNTAVGSLALQANTSGTPNTAVGYNALTTNISGAHNVAVGANALTLNTASQNTAVGSLALAANTGGTPNTAIGYNALNANISGTNNVAVGDNALRLVTTTNNNTAVGSGTGQTLTGSGCTYIGANIVASTAGVLNEVVIGQGITGAGQNTVAIGTNSTTYATLSSAGLLFNSTKLTLPNIPLQTVSSPYVLGVSSNPTTTTTGIQYIQSANIVFRNKSSWGSGITGNPFTITSTSTVVTLSGAGSCYTADASVMLRLTNSSTGIIYNTYNLGGGYANGVHTAIVFCYQITGLPIATYNTFYYLSGPYSTDTGDYISSLINLSGN